MAIAASKDAEKAGVSAVSSTPGNSDSTDTASLAREQLGKLLDVAAAALKQQVNNAAPFMLSERRARIERWEKLPGTTDNELAEKYRRLLEAFRVELDYGKSIEAYQAVLRVAESERLVNFLRVGQLALYYQTFDGLEGGIWSRAQAKWQPLTPDYNQLVGKGLRIARKLEPPQLMMLPLFGMEIAEKPQMAKSEAISTEIETAIDAQLAKKAALLAGIRDNAASLKTFYLQQAPADDSAEQMLLLDRLIDASHMPTLNELRQLFGNLQWRLAMQNRVSLVKLQVYAPNGLASEQQVLNAGGFSLISNGRYLSFSDTDRHVIELPRQPSADIQAMAQAYPLVDAKSLTSLAIDPSGGQILQLLVQVPTFEERIAQGGPVGYLILVLGFVSLLWSVYQFGRLTLIGKRIRMQLESSSFQLNNPLGRLFSRLEQSPLNDEEALYLVVEEALATEQAGLEQGLSFLKLVAAVAPMLGLLGTVTGMIETFQAIALHGSGDPKLMSGGISEALVTTVEGLVTAIPILLLHSVLSGKSQTLAATLEAHVSVALAHRLENRLT